MLQTLLSRQSTPGLDEGGIELPDDIELPFQTVAALQKLEIRLNEMFTQKVMVSVKQLYYYFKFQFYDAVIFSLCKYVLFNCIFDAVIVCLYYSCHFHYTIYTSKIKLIAFDDLWNK